MADTSFKSLFNRKVAEAIASRVQAVHPSFPQEVFVRSVMRELPSLELKGRSLCIASKLREHLPADYPTALGILVKSLGQPADSGDSESLGAFEFLPFLNFVGHFGLEHPELSLGTLPFLTKFFSAEFDIRPYLIQHRDLALAALADWAHDSDWRVRRLASEGSRPRLPWGTQVKEFIADPSPILPLLNHLFTDPHPVVRRSVANNLNDISKDHPDLAIQLARRWMKRKHNPETLQLLRHALRTLRKQGHRDVLPLLGLAHGAALELVDFTLEEDAIAIGSTLRFALRLRSLEEQPQRIAIQYAVHHLRKNGKTTPKIFHLAEREIRPGETIAIESKHSFQLITTRRYYPGEHRIEILAGGLSLGERSFHLREAR